MEESKDPVVAEEQESGDEEADKSAEPLPVFTLKVLKVVREAQQKHGLRHGDYQRYRSYCSRRIRRLRKYLHFVQGNKKNFRRKDVTEEVIKDEKFLYIPLMTIERAWAYAMQLKQEANTEPRKRFHLAARLRKAAAGAQLFQTLTDQSARVDARTKLEVQAYAADMAGTLAFEQRQWAAAMAALTRAQTIYQRLAAALNEDEALPYTSRADELTPSLRFCAYSAGDEAAGEELLKMRATGHNEVLDTLIAETRAKQAAALSEVTWRGRTVSVQHEKVRAFLLNVQDWEAGRDAGSQDGDEAGQQQQQQLDMYETLLMDCKDAINVVKDELRQDPTYRGYQPGGDAPVGSLHYLLTYLSYIRLNTTIERNLIIIANTEARLKHKTKGADGRKARPQDIIRLYEIILQNLAEVPHLAGLEGDLEIRSSVQAQTTAYKAFRCYHVSQSYLQQERWSEAVALLARVENYCRSALQSELAAPLRARVAALLAAAQTETCSLRARAILAAEQPAGGQQTAAAATLTPLSERLDQYADAPDVLQHVCRLPPPLQPLPCKPLFFDLALNQLQFPDVSAESGQGGAPERQASAEAAQPGGLTGFVKGLWGWGK